MAGVMLHVDFLETYRGGRHLVWNGFIYRHNNKRDTWISWKCTEKNCKATLCTRDDVPTKIGQVHNHLPDQAAVECKKIMNNVRTRVKTELHPLPAIYDEEISKLRTTPWDAQSKKIASKLPKFDAKKSSFYRSRKKTLSPIPNTRPEVQLEGKFTQTTSGEQFLQANDGDNDKILIFTTDENLVHLCSAEIVYCDGTFYTAPQMFDSIFTIHAFVGTVMFPFMYSLLPKRDTNTYNRLFTLLKDIAVRHNLDFSPCTVNLDFECASRNAVTQTLPAAELKGCLFHYTSTIWEKTQEYGLQTDYKNLPEVQELVRRAAALPLLPLHQREDCLKLTDYVTKTWIEGRYPQSTWNHFLTEGPRTNNHLEGCRNKLKKRVKTSHPNIYKIIEEFQRLQAATEVKIIQYAAGGQRRKKARKYREVEERLENLKTDLMNGTKDFIQYGDAASYILKLSEIFIVLNLNLNVRTIYYSISKQ
ncbi:uncharacterized protein LOC132550676 [Ylistrum balloti]|uniref:uncharacterized protein LOC132550676 n=1 Tax=Ylistrum balloti TaxID=509963 RepID=UPI002905DBF2|nr:uncharacterized protein LOC132550676 [Ylistrum balloti]